MSELMAARLLWRTYKFAEAARERARTDQVRSALAAEADRTFEMIDLAYRAGRSEAVSSKPPAVSIQTREPLFIAGYADGLLASLGLEP